MEYVVVSFPGSREVLIDEQPNGATNEVLRVGAGRHSFSLGGQPDFSPQAVTATISNTSVLQPKVITFEAAS
ncbi:hypothetical protein PVT67_00970 [Gallaecimonas kandeliae]|uniref:hypothetical protein n=1 Tax=Gallaecimonas kandeliae TaxID=3029055 RepID=UPI0026494AE6|nr:hypothetical protein [Gallaecimonas kandeliae]WKE65860.1 hypothetical protein PVT67_00970 [Gallaecimonas kandeliae]